MTPPNRGQITPEPGSVLGEGNAQTMGAPRRYPLELPERSVLLAPESGRPIRQVARDLGFHPRRCACGCGRRKRTAVVGVIC